MTVRKTSIHKPYISHELSATHFFFLSFYISSTWMGRIGWRQKRERDTVNERRTRRRKEKRKRRKENTSEFPSWPAFSIPCIIHFFLPNTTTTTYCFCTPALLSLSVLLFFLSRPSRTRFQWFSGYWSIVLQTRKDPRQIRDNRLTNKILKKPEIKRQRNATILSKLEISGIILYIRYYTRDCFILI